MVDVVEKINELVADVKSLKTLDIESGETIEQVEIAIGSFGIRTGSWNVYSVDIGSSTTQPRQQNRNPYAVVGAFIDIDELQIKGDIPALLRETAYQKW